MCEWIIFTNYIVSYKNSAARIATEFLKSRWKLINKIVHGKILIITLIILSIGDNISFPFPKESDKNF